MQTIAIKLPDDQLGYITACPNRRIAAGETVTVEIRHPSGETERTVVVFRRGPGGGQRGQRIVRLDKCGTRSRDVAKSLAGALERGGWSVLHSGASLLKQKGGKDGQGFL